MIRPFLGESCIIQLCFRVVSGTSFLAELPVVLGLRKKFKIACLSCGAVGIGVRCEVVKMRSYFGTLLFVMCAAAEAAVAANVEVKIIAGGSPCVVGPTNCVSLARTGKILIEDGEGTAVRVNVNRTTGITRVTLREGHYLFSYESGSGREEPIEQDVRGNATNVVFIKYRISQ